MTLYGLVTTCLALALSFGDSMYDISNQGLAIVKISTLDTIFKIVAFLVFIWFKPKTKQIDEYKFNYLSKLILFGSIIYLSLSIINYLRQGEISVNESLFPFGLFIENLARIAPFFGAFYWKRLDKFNRHLVILSLILFYLYAIPTGSRGLFVLSGFFLLFWCFRIGIYKALSLGLILVAIYAQVEDVHRSFRAVAAMKIDGDSRIEQLSNTSLEDIGADNVGFLESFRARVTHVYTLMGPLDHYLSTTNPVGLNPLFSSFQSIIPRQFIDTDKPWPGSVDGSKYSAFGYLVNDVATGSWWNMSEYPGVLHPIWEMGYMYSVISMFLSGLTLATLMRISKFIGDKLYIIPLVAIYPFTYSRFQPQIVEVPLMINYVVIPGIILYMIIRIIPRFKFIP